MSKQSVTVVGVPTPEMHQQREVMIEEVIQRLRILADDNDFSHAYDHHGSICDGLIGVVRCLRRVQESQRHAAFVCVTARVQLYRDYEHMDPAKREGWHRVVLMMARRDGLHGFPGGKVEPGESILQAAIREAEEEVGLNFREQDLVYLRSDGLSLGWDDPDPLHVHAFVHDKGDVGVEFLQWVIRRSLDAKHFAAEGSPYWMHLSDYGSGRGLPTTLQASNLAPAVREELDALLAFLSKQDAAQ